MNDWFKVAAAVIGIVGANGMITKLIVDGLEVEIDQGTDSIDEADDCIDETNRRMEARFTEMNGCPIADSAETNTHLIVLEIDLLQTGRAVA